jgi:signal-transduction protein with cAMP-binding, CBS, and nucleotidyltransferase domain
MSAPVHAIGADTLAAEASIAMLTFGVSHLAALKDDASVLGVVSASDLMSLDTRSPFALRRSLRRAHDEDKLVATVTDIPRLFVDLLDARLDVTTLSRVLTVLNDSLTARLMKDVQFEHHADAVRAGRTPDNTIVTDTLRPLTRANLQEALREVAAAQSRLPRVR